MSNVKRKHSNPKWIHLYIHFPQMMSFQRKRNFKIHSLSNKCHANASDLIFIGLANKCMRFYITPTEHKMILLLHVDEIFADEPLVSHKR